MKTLVAFIAAVCVCACARAGSIESATLSTNNVPVATTNTLNAVLSVEGMTTVPVLIQFVSGTNAATTGVHTLTFQKGIAGVWTSLGTVDVVPNGTNTSSTITNLSPGSLPTLRLTTWGNTNTNTLHIATNLSVKYWRE